MVMTMKDDCSRYSILLFCALLVLLQPQRCSALQPMGRPSNDPASKLTPRSANSPPSVQPSPSSQALPVGESLDRRSVLTNALWITAATASQPAQAETESSLSKPSPQFITTIILDTKDDKAGVRLKDATLQGRTYSVVEASMSQTVQPGMVVLGFASSSAVVGRLQNGPYPIVLQFYNTAEATAATPQQALDGMLQQEKGEGPPLSTKGTGLVTKTIRKGQCDAGKAKRGDLVTIRYEARVASPGGPIYDEGDSITFPLGKGRVVNGVDVGMAGMCVGEIRELDIPNALGYGIYGSDKYDVPGQVRLWWRLELLDVVKQK